MNTADRRSSQGIQERYTGLILTYFTIHDAAAAG